MQDKMILSENAMMVMRSKYLLPDETPEQMCMRLATTVADAELEPDRLIWRDTFYRLLLSSRFVPGGRFWANAGCRTGQIFNCFVLGIGDSLDEIYKDGGVYPAARVTSSGGGVGINYSALRPRGAPIGSQDAKASGPCSFMKVVASSGHELRQGGGRRGAYMGILNVDHPDIEEFIRLKNPESLVHFSQGEEAYVKSMIKLGVPEKAIRDVLSLTRASVSETDPIKNHNISVGIVEGFMDAAKNRETWQLKWNGKVHKEVLASDLLRMVAENAWATGDPGVAFLDNVNRDMVLPERVECSNPCGEQFLGINDVCNLGAVNLAAYVMPNGSFNFALLESDVRTAMRFLDNAIDISNYPLPEIAETAKAHRRVGLGVMGVQDAMIKMGVRYDSDAGLSWLSAHLGPFYRMADTASVELALEKGAFSRWDVSKPHPLSCGRPRRNSYVTTIAPTGSTSMMIDVSSGVEPWFGFSFVKRTTDGTGNVYRYAPTSLRDLLTSQGVKPLTDQELEEISNEENLGSIASITRIPAAIRDVCRSAMEIDWRWHVRVQATAQRHIDNSVSKTCNMRPDATVEDVLDFYNMAWELGCKGTTMYRHNSKQLQMLDFSGGSKEEELDVDDGPHFELNSGYRARVPYGSGNHLYVNIFPPPNDESTPHEIFIGTKTSSDEPWTTALTLVASLALQHGVPPEELIKKLGRITDANGGAWLNIPNSDRPVRIKSGPDAVAFALRRFLETRGHRSVEESTPPPSTFKSCKSCGGKLTFESGCHVCRSCGIDSCS